MPSVLEHKSLSNLIIYMQEFLARLLKSIEDQTSEVKKKNFEYIL